MFPALLNVELSLGEAGLAQGMNKTLTDVVMALLIAPLKEGPLKDQAEERGCSYQLDVFQSCI